MDKCKCSLAISLNGDGCRYCQPQGYIDRLHDQIDEERSDENKKLKYLYDIQMKTLIKPIMSFDEWLNAIDVCMAAYIAAKEPTK